MSASKQTAFDYIDEKSGVITDVSDKIWDYAELSLREYKSGELYAKVLKEEGFTVEHPFDNIETAFRASYGSGKPVIGILAEYDALTGLSQIAGSETRKELVADGNGHGCGHNLLGAGSMAAAFAIKKYLEEKGYADHIIELEESSATVQLAAEALGVEPGMIAKTMSFLVDGEPILILTEGTAKVDNRKYKDLFHVKAKMIPFGEVEEYIGHAPGGVCPFGIKEGITVYLDESLKRFETVYPAAGNDHSAVRLTIAELEDVAGACGWIDVCKEILL